MRKIADLFMTVLMSFSFCACKKGFGAITKDAKKALSSTCGAKKATKDQYTLMADSKYSAVEQSGSFDTGAYAEIKKKDFSFFRFHTVLDTSKIKSVFKYLKVDQSTLDEENNTVAVMEVLVVEFSSKEAAASYYDSLKASREKTYKDNADLDTDMKNAFQVEENHFGYASETEFMCSNVYGSVEGTTVVYVRLAGPVSPTLKSEYEAFMDKMGYAILKP